MNVILFGPPGVGKSTLIGVLKSQGMRAVDLEDFYPSKVRFQLPSMVDGVVFGGADLNPRRSYPNTIKVLLHMEQGAYDERRQRRDQSQPAKAQQAKHSMEDWRNARYDQVIDASGTAMSTAAKIRELIRKEVGGN